MRLVRNLSWLGGYVVRSTWYVVRGSRRYALRTTHHALCLALIVATLIPHSLFAADETGWTPAQTIPNYIPNTLTPVMIADQNRTVHLFASQAPDEDDYSRAITYNQWRADTGWSKPVDIILPSQSFQARIKSVYLDPQGSFHLVFFDGDDFNADIFYTWAPAALAGEAPAWSKPVSVGPRAITPEVALINGDGLGNLVMLYNGNLGVGNSLYYVFSHDSGQTWGEPELLFSTYTLRERVFDIDSFYGESGLLHVAWNVTNARGRSVGGYYTQLNSLDGSGDWSEPLPLDTPIELGIAIPAVIEQSGVVYIMYNNGIIDDVAPVMWFRRSDNLGRSFSEPTRPFETQVGRNGSMSLVVDGSGLLHLFWGQRVRRGWQGKADLHAVWHSALRGGIWTEPESIVSGPPTEEFDPYDIRAVVVQGNHILLTWRTDPGAGIPGIFYSYKPLNVPETALVALPTAPPTITPRPTITPLPDPLRANPSEPTTRPLPPELAAAPVEQPNNPGYALLVGGAPVLLLLSTLAWLQRRRRRALFD